MGNSRGVLIPAAFLAECKVGAEIELRQEGGCIIIEPVKAPRAGWFDGYRAKKDADAWEGLVETPAEGEEWQW
ncbi:MAG: AbrB/MazE/SpoVT family DNA-binding domain-containing protein [Thermodesulfobacteriota bacterium]